MDYLTWTFLVLGGLLVLVDFVIPSGGLISGAGISLLVMAALHHQGFEWWVLGLVFFPITIGSAIVIFKVAATGGSLLERWFIPDRIQSGVDALPGAIGTMLDESHAQVHGDRWNIESEDLLQSGDASRQLLEELGYPLTWRTYPMQHSICEPEMRDLAEFFVGCLSGSTGTNHS